MRGERRKYQRAAIQGTGVPGEFHLHTGGQSFQFTRVHDVSISGMGVSMPISLLKGEIVSLNFRSTDFSMALAGKVMWCVSQEPEAGCPFRVGIEFDSGQQNDSAVFFMTLREYLENFEDDF
ncbi:MAG: PilZ domain-containing protein [Gammaproteobacteria bacterium]|nr:PilZ domain-containing protein [Gammaproteobacteria bacterium]